MDEFKTEDKEQIEEKKRKEIENERKKAEIYFKNWAEATAKQFNKQ